MANTQSTKQYTVLGAGAMYKAPGEDGASHLGLQGRVIGLGADEAERLLGIGAVREATEADLAREERASAFEDANRRASDPVTNPYGGTARVSPQDHAAQVYESLTVEDLQAEGDRRGLTIEGTGAGGNVVKADLVAALVAYDAPVADEA